MIMLKGTIQHGQVVLPQPANLPDGTEVTVLTHEQAKTPPLKAWPAGFFEATAGKSVGGVERPPQGEFKKREEL